jgi:ribonuclease-3
MATANSGQVSWVNQMAVDPVLVNRGIGTLLLAHAMRTLALPIRLYTFQANAGARTRPAILADVCEALIGAVYLDGGFAAAEALIGRLWQVRMKTKAEPARDPKTVLQEWAQGRGLPTPAYREIARSGPDHDPQFRVAVQLPHLAPAEGSGRSKRAAEQAAAAAMMKREGVKPQRLDG